MSLKPYKITIELSVECPYANLSEKERALKCDFLGVNGRLADIRLIPKDELPTVKSWCNSCMYKGLECDIKAFTKQFKGAQDPIVKVRTTFK